MRNVVVIEDLISTGKAASTPSKRCVKWTWR